MYKYIIISSIMALWSYKGNKTPLVRFKTLKVVGSILKAVLNFCWGVVGQFLTT